MTVLVGNENGTFSKTRVAGRTAGGPLSSATNGGVSRNQIKSAISDFKSSNVSFKTKKSAHKPILNQVLG
jgi:hypothetical protein